MECTPAPATEGTNVLPTMPAPVQEPPEGNAISISAAAFIQNMVSAAATDKEGAAFTVIGIKPELLHPFPLVKVYITEKFPAPAMEGLNKLPLTPAPDQEPPEGMPTKAVLAELVQNTVAPEATLTVGNGFTVINCVAEFTQPLPSVPVTVYVVVDVGLNTIPSDIPLDHT